MVPLTRPVTATRPHRPAAVHVAAALAVLLGPAAALAQDAPIATLPAKCEQVAAERIGALGLANSVQRGVSSEIRSGVNVPSGYRARFYDPSCNGYVVVSLNGLCGLEQVYTTGACRMPGLAHW